MTKKQREVHPRLLKEFKARIAKGKKTYGTTLYTFNKRSALQDALEEAMDLSFYLMQKVMEEEDEAARR